jgi:hypothetical protein
LKKEPALKWDGGNVMKIKLDEKHFLNSDQFCYWITCEVEGKKRSDYVKRVSGYHSTIDKTLRSYIDRNIRSSEAQTLEELTETIEALKETVGSWKLQIEKCDVQGVEK